MKREGLRSPRGIASAAVLVVAASALATLCIRTTALKLLPPATPLVAALAPHDPDIVLEAATVALVKQRGIVSAATLAAVRRAAVAAPLDARPYLVLGHQQLLDDQPQRALATLEAGQRLDPRQRVIHLLLLDRYLRTGRFAQAAAQFAIAGRLVGPARGPITAAIAQMSLTPATHDAIRQTLRSDPVLEQTVLVALANADTPPATIFALASPAAVRDAGASWGAALVSRLVQQEHFGAARAVWQRIYRLSDAQVAASLYDAGLSRLPGSAPFNWALAAGGLGAADMQNHSFVIDYYGRDSGELASQLLVLPAGRYRFDFTVEGSKTGNGPALFWVLTCVSGSKVESMKVAVTATGAPHRAGTSFTVPDACPAQHFALVGEAGDFPAPMNVTLRDLALRATPEGQP